MKVREVKCPACGHGFMWMETVASLETIEYHLKETGELLPSGVCPKCEIKLVFLPHELEGAMTGDNRLIAQGIRGI